MPLDYMPGEQEFRDENRLYEDDRVNGDPNRSSQEEAEYKPDGGGPGDHACSNCMFFVSKTDTMGFCTKVRGVIRKTGYSHYYTDFNGVRDHKEEQNANTGMDV